ncbi:hypothetical protein PACTADRAFT_77407 [Pachysolen tannophilus NRRL Y-2460]|uniref:Uncharacterized protein n=1 Tax=Pachysolen tannophilus NRRL Y-2460 TaxID=669874 RepID=A0A1E4TQ84_PACTA|nr:hypothetical protein PACTADRAFT_77407 [Pachysolen tannophilus NRRL Y-2460]
MRGYLLGILQSNNIPDFEKIKILHNMISKEVHLQRKTTIGSQIIITFVNSILESLDDNNFSTLNTTDQLIWGINQYLQKFTPQISQVNENTCTSSSSSSSIDKVLTTTAIILNSTLENNNNSSFPEKWNEKLLELKRNEKGFWSIEYQMMKEKKKEKKKSEKLVS